MDQSEYYPIYKLHTCPWDSWKLLDSYGKFAIISCHFTLQVTSCHCVLVSCETAQWRKTFLKHRSVAVKSHHEPLSPTVKHSLHGILQADFFLLPWPAAVEVGSWWCPFKGCLLCSQVCCIAVWQVQYKERLLCFEKLLCEYTTENFSYQKSKDACTYRYIGIHVKKPLELWLQFIPGDSTFLSVWTLGWVWSWLLLLCCISLMILLFLHWSLYLHCLGKRHISCPMLCKYIYPF